MSAPAGSAAADTAAAPIRKRRRRAITAGSAMANSSGMLCSTIAIATTTPSRGAGEVGVGHREALGEVVQDQPERHEVDPTQLTGPQPGVLCDQVDVRDDSVQHRQQPRTRQRGDRRHDDAGFPRRLRQQLEEREGHHHPHREPDARCSDTRPGTDPIGQTDSERRGEDRQRREPDHCQPRRRVDGCDQRQSRERSSVVAEWRMTHDPCRTRRVSAPRRCRPRAPSPDTDGPDSPPRDADPATAFARSVPAGQVRSNRSRSMTLSQAATKSSHELLLRVLGGVDLGDRPGAGSSNRRPGRPRWPVQRTSPVRAVRGPRRRSPPCPRPSTRCPCRAG